MCNVYEKCTHVLKNNKNNSKPKKADENQERNKEK